MPENNTQIAYANELIAALSKEELSLIDFDRLRQWLSDAIPSLEASDRYRRDNELLRQDCVNRIGGMVKAMAALKRRPEQWEEALVFVDRLPTLSASELITQYRRTAARFRDAFPASFTFGLGRRRGIESSADVGDYK